jgi:hypothetical protein
MAKLVLWRCELCSKLEEAKLTAKLIIENKAETKTTRRITICGECFNGLLIRIDNPDDKTSRQNIEAAVSMKVSLAGRKTLEDGSAIIPSRNLGVAANKKPQCLHERNSFEDSFVVCKDCGEKSY